MEVDTPRRRKTRRTSTSLDGIMARYASMSDVPNSVLKSSQGIRHRSALLNGLLVVIGR
jgi:hypothetical protein